MKDAFGRTIDYLRLAVTDRCNLRCVYCMPEEDDSGLPLHQLSLEAIERILRTMASLGIKKVKITGGEPLIHPDIVRIVSLAKSFPPIHNVTLTTNGLLLKKLARPLAEAGLDAVNISLDTLAADRFRSLTRRDLLPQVLAGLDEILQAGSLAVKVNCVPTAQSPPEDLTALAALARSRDLHVRFIELMPIGLGRTQEGLDPERLKDLITRAFGPLEPCRRQFGNGPAVYYSLPGFAGRIGFISAVNSCFCEHCNRVRVTSDGVLKTCLHMDKGLKLPLDDEAAMAEAVRRAVFRKPASHRFASGEDGQAEDRIMSRIGG
ncbi:MAG: GTP 3',8-cyclase MoaA [Deltaproteobacteria bacterium]|jgi:cyclic pyranopterin phosphate synthase|nr:GTP 3',8-cyclase MoaA [Deltaproteobacteria bacterium]